MKSAKPSQQKFDRKLPPKRKCHNCGKPCTNYRCEDCWRKIRGFGLAGANDYAPECV